MPPAPRLLTPADLADPTKYTRSVLPVFGPHVRRWKKQDGTELEIRVTAKDLPDICEASNRPWRETHTPARLTVGHTVQGMAIPEATQPRNVGYAVEFRVGKLNGKPWIYAAICSRADAGVIVGEYPFRSAEYDPATKRISGIALLVQDPFLDQGAVHYQSTAGTVVFYQRANPVEPTPEEEAMYAKICAYMKKRYSKLAQYMDEPSATNTGIPNIEPGNGGTPPIGYSRPPEYTALEADNLRLTLERELDTLAYQGIRFDRAKELATLTGLAAASRVEHVAYMKANYGRVPVSGGFLPVAPSGSTAPTVAEDKPLTAAQVRDVLAYQKANGLSYADALTRFRTGTAK